jgi:hypothetical protein
MSFLLLWLCIIPENDITTIVKKKQITENNTLEMKNEFEEDIKS